MDSLARLDAIAGVTPAHREQYAAKVNDEAARRVSSFLSDSRILAERAKLCQHSGCAFLCTGLTPKYCCRLCAKSPGKHGPKCERKLLPCSTPGCTYAVTGLSATHCCKACAYGKPHGPNCWCLKAEVEEEAEAEAGMLCEEVEPEDRDAVPSGGGAELMPLTAPSSPAGDENRDPANSGMMTMIDVSDAAEIKQLAAQVDEYQSEIEANAAVIQALRDALAR